MFAETDRETEVVTRKVNVMLFEPNDSLVSLQLDHGFKTKTRAWSLLSVGIIILCLLPEGSCATIYQQNPLRPTTCTKAHFKVENKIFDMDISPCIEGGLKVLFGRVTEDGNPGLLKSSRDPGQVNKTTIHFAEDLDPSVEHSLDVCVTTTHDQFCLQVIYKPREEPGTDSTGILLLMMLAGALVLVIVITGSLAVGWLYYHAKYTVQVV